jgi:hypothetical protein
MLVIVHGICKRSRCLFGQSLGTQASRLHRGGQDARAPNPSPQRGEDRWGAERLQMLGKKWDHLLKSPHCGRDFKRLFPLS